jgi:hypothetical protein
MRFRLRTLLILLLVAPPLLAVAWSVRERLIPYVFTQKYWGSE